jgi:hypothetical protein
MSQCHAFFVCLFVYCAKYNLSDILMNSFCCLFVCFHAGPCWIWHELEFNESEDGNTVQVNSPQFGTAVDYPMQKVAGFHYCKVLSPARVIEWMYVDGLRAKYSLRTYNGTTATPGAASTGL